MCCYYVCHPVESFLCFRVSRVTDYQPVQEAVSYRGLFTADWFGVREKHCSRLEIYNRLRASEQAIYCVLQLSSCCVAGYLFKCCYYVCHPSSKTCDLGLL